MPNFYLVKSEPYVFSFADLQRDGRAMWDGVRNFEARNNLRAMARGDLLLFYHSNEGKEVVGVAQVVKTAYADPTADPKNGGEGGDWSVVDVAPVCPLKKPVTLDAIRGESRLCEINLLRRNRLSVVPVTAAEFALILKMGQTTLPRTSAAPTRTRRTSRVAVAGLLLWLGGSGLAPTGLSPQSLWAQSKPAEGKLDATSLLDARLVDLQDRVAPLRGYFDRASGAGKVIVVLHQDRKSADENAEFKTELGALAARHLQHLKVVALADVDGYDFWPAKGYVKEALRPLAADGAAVLCDWHGVVRKAYGLRAGQSAVFVLSSSGELALLSRGRLSIGESKVLLRGISELLPTAAAPAPATP